MKKFICMLLVVVMMLSLVACKGKTEPVATTPTVETVVDTPTEAPTEAPTEPIVERVAPTDFVAVNPNTLPLPTPVEEQLQAENTQTVVLSSIEEYEDLLWDLGFQEVRLDGTHEAYAHVSENQFALSDAYCQPVSLTYNENAFRLDFTYCMDLRDGGTVTEAGWYMYGTKSNVMANVSPMVSKEYYPSNSDTTSPFSVTFDGSQFATEEEALAAALAALQSGALDGDKTTIKQENPNYEEDIRHFGRLDNDAYQFVTKTVYYPVTGNLYNYMRDTSYEGVQQVSIVAGESSYSITLGMAARTMCFHYLFPEE